MFTNLDGSNENTDVTRLLPHLICYSIQQHYYQACFPLVLIDPTDKDVLQSCCCCCLITPRLRHRSVLTDIPFLIVVDMIRRYILSQHSREGIVVCASFVRANICW